MKNKKVKTIILILIILVIAVVAIFWLLQGNDKNNSTIDNQEQLLEESTTTVEDRNFWNEFLIRNPYLSKINIKENEYVEENELINLAISSQDIEKEFITDEEVELNPLFNTGGGYKKLIESINEYLKNTFNKEIKYNFVETYCENGEYLIINNDYVYFTELELPSNYYILVNLENKDGIYKAEIYEYLYNEETKDRVEEMLETGKIDKTLEIANRYIITARIDGNNICVLSKT